ncbi:MAG: hypothetical protein H6746_06360 [Deltaproteobacteria bacterium]|nr:hypothetical protein [Deltaproteobacteria bacterium]
MLSIAMVALVAGCGSPDVVGGADGTGTDAPESDGAADSGAETTGLNDAVADTELEIDVVQAKPGEFGYPCDANDECFSGFCVPTPGGSVCTQLCESACPDGFVCRPQLQGDVTFVCLPKWLYLCSPCNVASDCTQSASDVGHFCIDYGAEGHFCGGECKSDGRCPANYSCQNVPVGGGVIEKQCVPDSQTCECSPLAVQLQLDTTCTVTNEFGSCRGSRVCSPNGLTACDALTPAAETCNGQDDNCNGATDDLPPDYQCAKQNANGVCLGKGTCVGGVEICDAPSAQPEVCDGTDNDCDNATDESFVDTDIDGKADCVDEGRRRRRRAGHQRQLPPGEERGPGQQRRRRPGRRLRPRRRQRQRARRDRLRAAGRQRQARRDRAVRQHRQRLQRQDRRQPLRRRQPLHRRQVSGHRLRPHPQQQPLRRRHRLHPVRQVRRRRLQGQQPAGLQRQQALHRGQVRPRHRLLQPGSPQRLPLRGRVGVYDQRHLRRGQVQGGRAEPLQRQQRLHHRLLRRAPADLRTPAHDGR